MTEDGTAASTVITIDGTNDAAVISGTTTGAVVEAGGVNNGTLGTPTATGTLTDTDVDNAANTFQAVSTATASIGGYGTLYGRLPGASGPTRSTTTNSAVQALNAGDQLTDTFTV